MGRERKRASEQFQAPNLWFIPPGDSSGCCWAWARLQPGTGSSTQESNVSRKRHPLLEASPAASQNAH